MLGWVGILATVAFAVGYLAVFVLIRARRNAGGAPFRLDVGVGAAAAIVAGLTVLAVVMCLAVGEHGDGAVVYVAVIAVCCLPTRWGWAVAVAVAVGTYLATLLVPGWHEDRGLLFGALVAALAVWSIQQAIWRNVALLQVREENARLAVEHERDRFARDLHDILGHSLTVITVKAELANRLIGVDAERTRAELADVERLSRDALSDVRRAVQGYRVTLPGELARAREALSAAEIEAVLPNSTDEVPSRLRELFAWTVREGVTNVLRHSGAARCIVRLGPDLVEVEDDGCGASDGTGAGTGAAVGTGHGLLGLRERADATGAVLVTRSVEPHGFLLQVAAR